MKLTRNQFLAALAILTSLPARLLTLSSKATAGGANRPPAPAPLAGLRRDGPWLADWRQAHWVPVTESVHPTAQRLILAAARHEMLTLRYWGGSTPGRIRRVSPTSVFQLGGCGPLYLSGYCHLRRAERVFNVGRVELLTDDSETICITE
jgi:predicted DNA-binding transcriptional regulator YafY